MENKRGETFLSSLFLSLYISFFLSSFFGSKKDTIIMRAKI